MSKFKVGDRVRVKDTANTSTSGKQYSGSVGTVSSTGPGYVNLDIDSRGGGIWDDEIELVNNGENKMSRRTFRLKKDNHEFKKGTLYQEACDDGTQEYVVLDIQKAFRFDDWDKYFHNPVNEVSRDTVEQNPDWFEEVFPATESWLTAEEKQRYKDFLKGKTPQKSSSNSVTESLRNVVRNQSVEFPVREKARIASAINYLRTHEDKKFSRKTRGSKMTVTRIK